MGFLAPIFLAGLAAVAVPIVLHLFRREIAPPVPFTAVRFLQKRTIERQERRRIQDPWLLLLRVAALALLALAFARPYLRVESKTQPPVVLAVDVSYSMGAPGGSRRRATRPREALGDLSGRHACRPRELRRSRHRARRADDRSRRRAGAVGGAAGRTRRDALRRPARGRAWAVRRTSGTRRAGHGPAVARLGARDDEPSRQRQARRARRRRAGGQRPRPRSRGDRASRRAWSSAMPGRCLHGAASRWRAKAVRRPRRRSRWMPASVATSSFRGRTRAGRMWRASPTRSGFPPTTSGMPCCAIRLRPPCR